MSPAREASLRAVKTVITCEKCGVSYEMRGCCSITELKILLKANDFSFGKYIKCPNCRPRAKKRGAEVKRKCKSCFRYTEVWRDARAKGLKERDRLGYKPRKGVAAKCLIAPKDKPVSANDKGCKYHKYRWSWNLGTWWKWSVSYKFGRWICEHIICPIGGLRKPVPLDWVDSFNVMTDKNIKNGEPKCPHCGEMPYSIKQCVFCGQRFIQEENANESSITKHKA